MNSVEVDVRFTVHSRSDRGRGDVVVVGDDPQRIAAAHEELNVTPRSRRIESDGGRSTREVVGTRRSMDDFVRTLRARDVDCVALAFRRTDRSRFFGALRACRENDVPALVPPDQADSVLVSDAGGDWSRVEFHPWSRSRRALKRAFDVAFAVLGLALLAPFIVLIALAIKLDSRGPALYAQERTGYLGETFRARKFRTMYPESENPVPEDDRSNDRITPIGRLLRKTHVDEVPQLVSILRGDMSAVGPRATWIEEEDLLRRDAPEWEKRYFVKPGLTGLAQVNGVTSTMPRAKLRYDLEYVRNQSLALDARIVAFQIAIVVGDLLDLVERRL